MDGKLYTFWSLCKQIESEPSLSVKQEIISGYLSKCKVDVPLLYKLLLPKYNGRLYHVQDKQLVKLFSLLLGQTEKVLKDHLNKSGCIAATASHFFCASRTDPSNMTMEEFDKHLEDLSTVTTEDAQLVVLRRFLTVATKNDLFLFLRQVKQDLRLGAGIRCILAGLHPCANNLFKRCANIQEVVKKVMAGDVDAGVGSDSECGSDVASSVASGPRGISPDRKKVRLEATVTLGMPIAPMLAAPTKGVEQVLLKCPNGAFSETKYDGERIQIHKNGTTFKYFARSLKPMKADKHEGLDAYIVSAVKADSCILDGEILLIDTRTSTPLPFGTLGKHKKAEHTYANTCIFLFDIMFLNGKALLDEPLELRRLALKSAVAFIPNRIMISEMREVRGSIDERRAILDKHLRHAIAEGLEGLVIKDVKSHYEPSSRHWVKLKKDYLAGMADSADLLVLGAWYGTGAKGGLLSTFLMCVWDKRVPAGHPGQFKTVVKVGNGHDDATLEKLNRKFATLMVPAHGKAPVWLDVHNSHIPDMVVIDPMRADVWEIIGAQFSRTKTHTAGGISFRFPRILKIRDDKDVNTATSLDELIKLAAASSEKQPLPVVADDDIAAEEEPKPAEVTVSAESSVPSTVSARSDVQYVSHDIAQPLVDAASPHENMIIAHVAAIGAKWSNRGVMGAITNKYGDEAKECYEETAATAQLGDVQITSPENRMTKGTLYVATLLAQKKPTFAGATPQVDSKSLELCIRKCGKFAHEHKASFHFAKLDESTGVEWRAVEKLLQEVFVTSGVRCVVYSRDALARASSMSPSLGVPARAPSRVAPPPAPARAAPGSQSSSLSASQSPLVILDSHACMSQVRVFFAGLTPREKESAQQKAVMLGATPVEAALAATHIVTSRDCPATAIPSDHKAKIVAKEWIDNSFLKNAMLPLDSYILKFADAPRVTPQRGLSGSAVFDCLKGCYVVLHAFVDPELTELSNKIKSMGGVVQSQWKMIGADTSTHLVCGYWTQVCSKVCELGGVVVARSWVDEAFTSGMVPNVKKHLVTSDAAINASEAARAHALAPAVSDAAPQAPPVADAAPFTSAGPLKEKSRSFAATAVPVILTKAQREVLERPAAQWACVASVNPSALRGVVVAIEGYGEKQKAAIRSKVEAMGGRVLPAFSSACHYLICETLTTVSETVPRNKVIVRGWIDSLFEGKCADKAEAFVYQPTIPLAKATSAERPQQAKATSTERPQQVNDVDDETDLASTPKDDAVHSDCASTEQASTLESDDPPQAPFPRRKPVPESDDSTDEEYTTPEYESPAIVAKEDEKPDVTYLLPPAVFDGISATFFCDNPATRATLERYFTAYGGTVRSSIARAELGVSEKGKHYLVTSTSADVTNVMRMKERMGSAAIEASLAPTVSERWMWECIRKAAIQPSEPFVVRN